jgi:hypothetical protein
MGAGGGGRVVFAMWPAAIFRPGSNILQRYHDVSQSFHLAADRVLILEHD